MSRFKYEFNNNDNRHNLILTGPFTKADTAKFSAHGQRIGGKDINPLYNLPHNFQIKGEGPEPDTLYLSVKTPEQINLVISYITELTNKDIEDNDKAELLGSLEKMANPNPSAGTGHSPASFKK